MVRRQRLSPILFFFVFAVARPCVGWDGPTWFGKTARIPSRTDSLRNGENQPESLIGNSTVGASIQKRRERLFELVTVPFNSIEEIVITPQSDASSSFEMHSPLANRLAGCQEGAWQLFPAGLMYQSYLAGPKEPRFNAVWARDHRGKLNWETQLGGRVGILRYGDLTAVNPNGWQFDLEGGAQTRVLPEVDSDLEAADFRIGFLMTHRRGLWAFKSGYYHLSSHVGDEFLIDNSTFTRINYVRDSMVVGVSRDILWKGRRDFRVYGEFAYAFSHEFARPMEFQTGAEYSPLVFNNLRGTPFIAVNGHFREDRKWDATGLCVTTGWQWRSAATNHRFRLGVQYYTGDSLQWSFAGQKESSFGWGIWFDY